MRIAWGHPPDGSSALGVLMYPHQELTHLSTRDHGQALPAGGGAGPGFGQEVAEADWGAGWRAGALVRGPGGEGPGEAAPEVPIGPILWAWWPARV